MDVRVEGPVDLSLEPGRFALGFGARVPRPVLCWRYKGDIPLAVTTELSVR
jgi:hypothetical protein